MSINSPSSLTIGPDYLGASMPRAGQPYGQVETFQTPAAMAPELSKTLQPAISQIRSLETAKRLEYLTVVKELASNKQVAPERINLAVRSMGRTLHQLEQDVGTAKNRLSAAKKLEKASKLREEWKAASEAASLTGPTSERRLEELQAEIDSIRASVSAAITNRDVLHARATSMTSEAMAVLNPTGDQTIGDQIDRLASQLSIDREKRQYLEKMHGKKLQEIHAEQTIHAAPDEETVARLTSEAANMASELESLTAGIASNKARLEELQAAKLDPVLGMKLAADPVLDSKNGR